MAELNDTRIQGKLSVTGRLTIGGEVHTPTETKVSSNRIKQIVTVTKANYPASPDPDVIYMIKP